MLGSGTLLSARYRIHSVLGRGGMGAVYLAQVEALGKKVAVKEMELRGLSQGELTQAVRQFQKEAAFLANLEHPNLVPVTDYFRVDNKHYLVMAYVEGQNLQEMLVKRGHPYNWPDIRDWTYRLIEVLSFLHSRNPPILFRDLKPSNIMIAKTGRLHLIDFGIARTARVGDRTSTFLQGTGTKGFSPIEQYGEGHSTDQRSDIYSLGATLYYLLTGKLPPDAVERVSLQRELVPPSHHNPSLPTWLDQLIVQAMAVAPPERYQSVQEMGAALRRLDSMEEVTGDSLQPVGPGSLEEDRMTTVCPSPPIQPVLYDTKQGSRKKLGLQGWWSAGLTAVLFSLGFLAFPSAERSREPSLQAPPRSPQSVARMKESETTPTLPDPVLEERLAQREVRLGGHSPASPSEPKELPTSPQEESSKVFLTKSHTKVPRFSLGGQSYPKARLPVRAISRKSVSQPSTEAAVASVSPTRSEVPRGSLPPAPPPVRPQENNSVRRTGSEAAPAPSSQGVSSVPPPPPPAPNSMGGRPLPEPGFGRSGGVPGGGPVGGGGGPRGGR